MYARRRLPHRLIAAIALASLGPACSSSRYLGALSPENTYVNRGFGIVARLSSTELLERWAVVSPQDRQQQLAPDVALNVRQGPLDLDADGELAVTETQRFVEPALRLYDENARSVRMDLTVQILPRRYDEVPIDSIVASDIRALRPSTPAEDVSVHPLQVAGGFSARTVELSRDAAQSGYVRRTIIDQAGFIGEEGLIRRQIVRVTLFSSELTEALRRDHDAFVASIILNRKGGFTSVKEAW